MLTGCYKSTLEVPYPRRIKRVVRAIKSARTEGAGYLLGLAARTEQLVRKSKCFGNVRVGNAGRLL